MSDFPSFDRPAPQLPTFDPSAPTLTDRLDGPSPYLLPDGTLVTVVPRGGVPFQGMLEPVDQVVAGLQQPRDALGRFTVRDLQRAGWLTPTAMALPPSDVPGPSFSCCANCSTAGPAERCSGCPRPRHWNFSRSQA